jgi:hypothetical protein
MPESQIMEWKKLDKRNSSVGEKNNREAEGGHSHPPLFLFFEDRLDRADLKAASTFSTFLFINYIGLSLFNRICRTFFRAGSTGHAFIGDHISHSHHPL